MAATHDQIMKAVVDSAAASVARDAELSKKLDDIMAKLGNAATPTPTQPTNPTVLNLPRVPWYGGPNYWSKFSRATAAGWTKDTFFPIAVWYGRTEDGGQKDHATILKSVGVNVYMGAEKNGTLKHVTDLGISVIAQDSEWSASDMGDNNLVVGHHLSDEIEMNDRYGDDAARLNTLKRQAAAGRAFNDGRFVQANFGNGVMATYWAVTNNASTFPQYLAAVDTAAVDKYAYTSPNVRFEIRRSAYWPNATTAGANKDGQPSGPDANKALTYGWLADRMNQDAGYAKPEWIFVETAMPDITEAGAATITPAQMEGAIWSAIIHGAAGIALYQHNNDNTNNRYSIVESPDSSGIRTKLKAVTDKIASLAPVINTQGYVWNFGSDIDACLKAKDGYIYIFAQATSVGTKTFTLPSGVSGTTVELIGENRTIPVTAGKFNDSFGYEYTHHVYKVKI